MKWKEKFKKIKFTDAGHYAYKYKQRRKEIENFISTEIIEKLINEIPHYDHKTPNLNLTWDDAADSINLIKRQLRDKWLGE
jgi:hypothetical protein